MKAKRTITVVVNGVPVQVRLDLRNRVYAIVQSALRVAGVAMAPGDGFRYADWELRTSDDGRLIEQSLRNIESGIVAGETYFLQPKVGIGA